MTPEQRWFVMRSVWSKAGRLLYRLCPGNVAEIVDVEVDNEHRRTGLGRAMVEKMIKELPPEVTRVYAFMRSDNGIACDWYWALGFVDWPAPNFYPDGDALLMVLSLPKL